jgi:hypothetical protein
MSQYIPQKRLLVRLFVEFSRGFMMAAICRGLLFRLQYPHQDFKISGVVGLPPPKFQGRSSTNFVTDPRLVLLEYC